MKLLCKYSNQIPRCSRQISIKHGHLARYPREEELRQVSAAVLLPAGFYLFKILREQNDIIILIVSFFAHRYLVEKLI